MRQRTMQPPSRLRCLHIESCDVLGMLPRDKCTCCSCTYPKIGLSITVLKQEHEIEVLRSEIVSLRSTLSSANKGVLNNIMPNGFEASCKIVPFCKAVQSLQALGHPSLKAGEHIQGRMLSAGEDYKQQTQSVMQPLKPELQESIHEEVEPAEGQPGVAQCTEPQEDTSKEQQLPAAAVATPARETLSGPMSGAQESEAQSLKEGTLQQNKVQNDPKESNAPRSTSQPPLQTSMPMQQPIPGSDSHLDLSVDLAAQKRMEPQEIKAVPGLPLPAFATDTPDELEIDSDGSQQQQQQLIIDFVLAQNSAQTLLHSVSGNSAACVQQPGKKSLAEAALGQGRQAAEQRHVPAGDPTTCAGSPSEQPSLKPAQSIQPAAIQQSQQSAANIKKSGPAVGMAAVISHDIHVQPHTVSRSAVASDGNPKHDLTSVQPKLQMETGSKQRRSQGTMASASQVARLSERESLSGSAQVQIYIDTEKAAEHVEQEAADATPGRVPGEHH